MNRSLMEGRWSAPDEHRAVGRGPDARSRDVAGWGDSPDTAFRMSDRGRRAGFVLPGWPQWQAVRMTHGNVGLSC
jgi:hypothetical protein